MNGDQLLQSLIEWHTRPLRLDPIASAVAVVGKMPRTDSTKVDDLTGWRWPDGYLVAHSTAGEVWTSTPHPDGGQPTIVVFRDGRVVLNTRGTLGVLFDGAPT